MILLKQDEYKITVSQLKSVTINNLFPRSVVEQHVDGKVYVDDAIKGVLLPLRRV